MTTRIEIIKRAASQTGNGPLASVDDDSEVARIADESYESIVATALTQHSWKFARQAFVLTELETVPEAPWVALWQKPPLMLATAYLTYSPEDSNGTRIAYEERNSDDGAAYAVAYDYDELYAVGTARVDESIWPADFAKAIECYMQAVLHRGISFQMSAADQAEAKAEALLQRARVRDANSSTRTDPTPWDLTLARRRDAAWNIGR